MRNRGFTLIEMLVTIALLAVMGSVLTEVFVRTLRANNKSQVLSIIKQNGQTALESIDKAVRNSSQVLCPITSDTPSNILVISKENEATPPVTELYRFIYVAPTASTNGFIAQDTPTGPPASESDCIANLSTSTKITDNNVKTGVSVTAKDIIGNLITGPFKRNITPGSKDVVTINFRVGPGLQSPKAVTGQIDEVEFKTTVVLR